MKYSFLLFAIDSYNMTIFFFCFQLHNYVQIIVCANNFISETVNISLLVGISHAKWQANRNQSFYSIIHFRYRR
jgi:hypothetical protein